MHKLVKFVRNLSLITTTVIIAAALSLAQDKEKLTLKATMTGGGLSEWGIVTISISRDNLRINFTKSYNELPTVIVRTQMPPGAPPPFPTHLYSYIEYIQLIGGTYDHGFVVVNLDARRARPEGEEDVPYFELLNCKPSDNEGGKAPARTSVHYMIFSNDF